MFDICIVTYNSAKWIPACVGALSRVQYDLKELCLVFADNCSADDTVQILEQQKELYKDVFSDFVILPQQENGGFGKGSNAAARAGKADYVLFLNIDTEIFPDAFLHLEQAIRGAAPETAAFELRQFPYEHPKYYNPVTLETSWMSGACFVLKRSVFEQTGGFDESIFMYCEDVELSWHIRALGYKLQYVPAAAIWHYTNDRISEQKKSLQLIGQVYGNLVLRYKYGTKKQVKEGRRLMKEIRATCLNDETRKALWKSMEERVRPRRRDYRAFYRKIVRKSGFIPQFLGLDFEFARAGALYPAVPPKDGPEITVVVRTYRRPETLHLTLESLRHQTYRRFRVIVVEDGEQPAAQQVAQEAAGWFPLEYLAANSRWGRCRAGNEGVARAQTEHVCFLDDDDYFFADHLEVMARAIEEHPDAGLWCARAVEARCSDGQRMQPVSKRNIGKEELHPVDFFSGNPVPIQAVVFRKALYLEVGGLDPELDALEDWDLWMRMVCRASVFGVDKATSIFRVPADSAGYLARYKAIGVYRTKIHQKMAMYQLPVSAQDVYGLFWKPGEDDGTETLNREEWRVRALGLTNSGTWRATGWLRRFLYAANEKLRLFAGPVPISFETASAGELYAYCVQLEQSACWRVVSRLRQCLALRGKKK